VAAHEITRIDHLPPAVGSFPEVPGSHLDIRIFLFQVVEKKSLWNEVQFRGGITLRKNAGGSHRRITYAVCRSGRPNDAARQAVKPMREELMRIKKGGYLKLNRLKT